MKKLILIATLFLVACSGGSNKSPSTTTDDPSIAVEPIATSTHNLFFDKENKNQLFYSELSFLDTTCEATGVAIDGGCVVIYDEAAKLADVGSLSSGNYDIFLSLSVDGFAFNDPIRKISLYKSLKNKSISNYLIEAQQSLNYDEPKSILDLISDTGIQSDLSLVINDLKYYEDILVTEIKNHITWSDNLDFVNNNYDIYYTIANNSNDQVKERISLNLTLFDMIEEDIYDLYFDELMNLYTTSIVDANDLANIEFEVVNKSETYYGYIFKFPKYITTYVSIFDNLHHESYHSYYNSDGSFCRPTGERYLNTGIQQHKIISNINNKYTECVTGSTSFNYEPDGYTRHHFIVSKDNISFHDIISFMVHKRVMHITGRAPNTDDINMMRLIENDIITSIKELPGYDHIRSLMMARTSEKTNLKEEFYERIQVILTNYYAPFLEFEDWDYDERVYSKLFERAVYIITLQNVVNDIDYSIQDLYLDLMWDLAENYAITGSINSSINLLSPY